MNHTNNGSYNSSHAGSNPPFPPPPPPQGYSYDYNNNNNNNMMSAPPPPPPGNGAGNGDYAWGVPPQGAWNQQQMNFIPGYGQNFAPNQPPPQFSSGYPG